MPSRGSLIAGRFVALTPPHTKLAPSDTRHIITNFADASELLDDAVAAAAVAQTAWAARSLRERSAVLEHFAGELDRDATLLAVAVASEVGKPIAEARLEVASLSARIAQQVVIAARELVRFELPDGAGYSDLHPLGVFGVIGPFNFPLSLSHAHIVPALLAGNAVVLKPSESAPLCAELYAEAWMRTAEATGAPAAVFSLVHGHGATGAALASHPQIAGIAFTGSYAVGTSIVAANAAEPGRLVALELGGKNAAIVLADADLALAAREIARGGFETTGQRCTATSRVIVEEPVADAFLAVLLEESRRWVPGDPLHAETRMGPLTTERAALRFDEAQRAAADCGLQTLLPGGACDSPTRAPGHWVSPAVHEVLDVDGARSRWNDELFGPELLVRRATSTTHAIELARDSRYGLAASVFTSDPAVFEAMRPQLRAGLVNLNRRTSGADGRLPFGGIGHSGNHRPAGALALRYCVYPVATLRG